MELNKIYNEDCFITIQRMIEDGTKCDLVLTSPPYNTGKNVSGKNSKSVKNFDARYDIYLENKTDEEYIEWTVDLFKNIDKVLSENGIILYNMSYGSGDKNNGYKSNDLMWKVISEIITNTNLTVADSIIWKKKSALPNNRSSNKLTRIVEDVFVFCRRKEYMTFNSNKQVVSLSKRGQKNFENVYNFIEAKNNDGACNLNKATYSSDLCMKLLNIYAKPNSIVFDPFIGTGTTAVACKKLGHSYIGSELSSNQCDFADNRILNTEVC